MNSRNVNINLTRLKFKNNHVVYENFIKCTVKDYEFNLSYNPTLLSGSQALLFPYSSSVGGNVFYNVTGSKYFGILKDFVTGSISGSDFSPYVSTIGLYNDASELLAVAKMAVPTPLSPNTDMTFLVKFDTQWVKKPYFTPTPSPSRTPYPTQQAPSLTPTNTPTATPTVTPSVTPSVTPTISATPSITPTISTTPSITPTISVTPTITVTPSISVTPSITITPSTSSPALTTCYVTTFGTVPVSGGAGSFATGNITVTGGSVNVWAKYNSGGSSTGIAGFGMTVNSLNASGTFTIYTSGQTGYTDSGGTASGYVTLSPGTYGFTLTKSDNLTSGNNVTFVYSDSSNTNPNLASNMNAC